jgi:predicted transcriptional regulator
MLKIRQIPGRREMMILHAIWDRGEATVRDVHKEIIKNDDVAYTTIMTMMQKMEKKGLLEHYEENRAFVYRALVKKTDIESGVLHDLMDRVFQGSYENLVNTLVRDKKITVSELKKITDEIEKRRKK